MTQYGGAEGEGSRRARGNTGLGLDDARSSFKKNPWVTAIVHSTSLSERDGSLRWGLTGALHELIPGQSLNSINLNRKRYKRTHFLLNRGRGAKWRQRRQTKDVENEEQWSQLIFSNFEMYHEMCLAFCIWQPNADLITAGGSSERCWERAKTVRG